MMINQVSTKNLYFVVANMAIGGNNSVYCFLVDFFWYKVEFLEVFLISGMDIMNIVDFFGIYLLYQLFLKKTRSVL